MKNLETTAQRFNEIDMALESLELHILQAIWSLEKSVQRQIESNTKLQEKMQSFIVRLSQMAKQEIESNHARPVVK